MLPSLVWDAYYVNASLSTSNLKLLCIEVTFPAIEAITPCASGFRNLIDSLFLIVNFKAESRPAVADKYIRGSVSLAIPTCIVF